MTIQIRTSLSTELIKGSSDTVTASVIIDATIDVPEEGRQAVMDVGRSAGIVVPTTAWVGVTVDTGGVFIDHGCGPCTTTVDAVADGVDVLDVCTEVIGRTTGPSNTYAAIAAVGPGTALSTEVTGGATA